MITVSTSNPGSTWLDRLRSSRGFPTGSEPNLDRSLASSSSSATSATRSESTQFTRRLDSGGENVTNLAGDVSDVLSDLFYMGEPSRTFSKKNCRKQSNPRFFNPVNLIVGVDQEYPLPTVVEISKKKKNCRKQSNPRFFNSSNTTAGDKQLNPRFFNSPNFIGEQYPLSTVKAATKKNCRKQSNPRFFNSPNFISVDNEYPVPKVETATKKNFRQQSRPRFFNSAELANKNDDLCSSDDLRREKSENLLVSSGDNSLNDKILTANNDNKSRNNTDNDNGDGEEGEEEEEEEVIDMKEYTRSEVTVIDTSLEDWKLDKWVFRKKDEWKIKDKNKKSKFNSKKRKLFDENGGDVDVEMIKDKKIMHLNQPENDKARELLLKEAAKFVGNLPQSRFPCPRPPEKLRIEGSPVILLKSVPSSNNANGIIRLGKSAKKGRPKKMII